MANLVGFLALKGIAFGERYKEKDAYDIWSICEYYKKGPESVAEEIKSCRDNPIIREGLQAIRGRFHDVNSEGPSWVVNWEVLWLLTRHLGK